MELDIGHLKKEFGKFDLVDGQNRIGLFITIFRNQHRQMDDEENSKKNPPSRLLGKGALKFIIKKATVRLISKYPV